MMSKWVYYPSTITVQEQFEDVRLKLRGPNGKRLVYTKQPVGFDLRRKSDG